MTRPAHLVPSLAIVLAGSAMAWAGPAPISVTYPEPTFDRWMYPFNSSPGTRDAASTFTAIGQEQIGGFTFDQRDGQFLVSFDTNLDFPTGLGHCGYVVQTAVLRATVSVGDAFGYDPTQDPWGSYLLDTNDPDWLPDPDPGTGVITSARPLELFGAAYRGGFDVFSFAETSPHGPIQKEQRIVYPTEYIGGAVDDVANNVRDKFDPKPFALGISPGLTPGQTVPADTEFVFTLDVADPDVQRYLGQALSDGRLNLLITSLQPASTGGGGGPGAGEFSTFYTRDDVIFGIPATLELTVGFPKEGDADGNGTVDVGDITYVIFRLGNAGAQCVDGDADGNGTVDVGDISFVIFRLGT